jgi:hypothetical protein
MNLVIRARALIVKSLIGQFCARCGFLQIYRYIAETLKLVHI